MANVSITPGSGDTVAAEDISSVKYQQVKLIDATAASTTGTGIAANPLQVSLANTAANSTAVKVDGSAVTQPVSAASLPLPSGASTAAKQPALGTAGTASSDVITVQGIASMTPLSANLMLGGTAVSAANPVAIQPPASGHLNVIGDGTAGTPATGVLSVQGITSMTPIQVGDNSGSLTVDGAVTVTNATAANLKAEVVGTGTFAVQATIAAAATNIAKAEDVASADADVGVPAMAVRKATPANTSGTDGDYEMLQMSAGRLWTSATIDAALPAGTNGIGKLTSNSGVTIGAIEIAAAQTLATVTTVSTVTGGGVAHDSGDSGNPIKVGAKAITALSGTTLVSSADRTDLQSDLDGAAIVRTDACIGDYVNGNASNTDGASTQVLAAGASGIKHYITDVTIANTSASNIYVELKDGTTVKWTFPVPATGGVTHHFRTPIGGTAATAWNFDPSAAATTVYCSVSGFKSKI